MNEELVNKKKKIELMQLEMNILKLETRLLELDEEKEKIIENLKQQQEKLNEIKNGGK